MFFQPIFYNLKFSVTQAINPHIQQPANKFVEKAVSLPSKKVKKSGAKLPKKILGKDISLHAQPKTDMVVLSSAKTKVQKAQNKTNNSYGKNIKKVLNKYFDNSDVNAEQQIARQENLTSLVNSYEKENIVRQRKKSRTNETLKESRQNAIKLMTDYGKEQLAMFKEDTKQNNKLMANDIRKYYPEYVPNHEEIVYNTSKIYQ